MGSHSTGERQALEPAARILVPFAGDDSSDGDTGGDRSDGSRSAEMSWGQWEIWLAMQDQNSSFPIGGTNPLPAGTTVAGVAEELRYLVSRFQSMRTRLRFDPAGRPTQVLSSSGEIALEVYDAEGTDPAEVAAAVEDRYSRALFDYVGEWPVRMAVVRHHGVPTHQVTIMCHLVTDGWGGAVMLREVAARTGTPVAGMQALAQARWQRSNAGQRHNKATLRHWETLLRAIPARRLPGSADPRSPRHWEGELDSPALLLAVRAIAEHLAVDSAPVLLAVFAVALVRLTGIDPVVVRPVVSNRFRPGLADVVCNAAQNGLCVLEVSDASLAEAVRRAQRSAMGTYKYAYFDPEQMRALIAGIAAERGPDFDIGCFFNDRRLATRSEATGPPPTPQQVQAARDSTTFRWTIAQDDPFERLFLHVEDVPDTIRITIDVDTHHLAPADAEALVRGMEAVAVEAALDPQAPAVRDGA